MSRSETGISVPVPVYYWYFVCFSATSLVLVERFGWNFVCALMGPGRNFWAGHRYRYSKIPILECFDILVVIDPYGPEDVTQKISAKSVDQFRRYGLNTGTVATVMPALNLIVICPRYGYWVCRIRFWGRNKYSVPFFISRNYFATHLLTCRGVLPQKLRGGPYAVVAHGFQ